MRVSLPGEVATDSTRGRRRGCQNCGSTQEGIHLGAMAGSVDMVVRYYPGLEVRNDMLWLHPVLPPELTRVVFAINYREQPIRLELTASNLRLRLSPGGATPIRVRVEGQEAVLSPGQTRDFGLNASQ